MLKAGWRLIEAVSSPRIKIRLSAPSSFKEPELTEGDLTDFLSTSTPCCPCRQAVSFLCVLWETCLTSSNRFSTWNTRTKLEGRITHLRLQQLHSIALSLWTKRSSPVLPGRLLAHCYTNSVETRPLPLRASLIWSIRTLRPGSISEDAADFSLGEKFQFSAR